MCGFDESIETFSVEPFVETLEKEYNALTPSLNAIAPQKYLEISTGYRTMSNRKNDLEAERNSIWAFIESVEKEKKQTILDAFDTVDKEIRKIFDGTTPFALFGNYIVYGYIMLNYMYLFIFRRTNVL